MSENETGWVVETKPVVSTVIPTPEALVAREREARRPHRAREDNPILRRFSRGRHWSDVTAYDERARELEQRARALNDEIAHREQALVEARKADHDALTQWQLDDRRGARPEATVPAIEQEIAAKTAERDAALAACERVYEDKERYVEKHRRRLIREEDKRTREAQARYEQAIAEAEQARADLVASREAALWASLYPGELATQLPDVAAIATSLRKPVEAELQVKTRLDAAGVFRVLRHDAAILAEAMTYEQARELGLVKPSERDVAKWETGKPDYVGPRFPAAWAGSEEEKVQAERVKAYHDSLRRRLRGD